jgi:hypothetical protein
MRTRISILVITLVVSAGSLVWLLDQRAKRLDAEHELAGEAERRTQTQAEIRRAEDRVAAAGAERDRAALAANARQSAAAGATHPPVNAAPPVAALREAMLHDPELQNLQLAVADSKYTATYQAFSERMKFSPEQTAGLLANLRRRGEQEMDLAAVMETQHLAPNDPSMAKLKQAAEEEFRAAQTALLGDAGARQFQDYERAVPMREFVNELAGAMTVSGAAITAAQGDALVDLLANASAAYQRGGTASVRTIDWDQALARAETMLPAPQFTLFKNGVVQLRNMERLRSLAQQK